MPSEPSFDGAVEAEVSTGAEAVASCSAPEMQPRWSAGWSGETLSRNVAVGMKNRLPGDGGAEVEDAIVIAGRPADEHVLEHLLDGARRAAVADEIGAELAVAGPAEGHVVAEDFDFFAVFFDDGERVVRGGGLHGVVELDVGDFSAADDFFLGFGGELVPGVEIVKILLHDDVASAGEGGIFVANEDGIGSRAAVGFSVPSTKPSRSRSSK